MDLTVNGKHREVDGPLTLLQFLELHNVNPVLIAVEHNGDIIRREQYGELALREGDTLEIIHMVGGG
ncbi:MAG: sulfur carrier protein [Chloroflexota bacterium]|jgi:thiamine biosynthesis protein ThiS|nr:sulfur carrier protein [Chloroflexota bacterium]